MRGVNMTYVYCVKVKGTSKISLLHSCMSNRTVILRFSCVKRDCNVHFEILQGNRGECCAYS